LARLKANGPRPRAVSESGAKRAGWNVLKEASMSIAKKATLIGLAIGVASTALFVAAPLANAQGASCDRLWYERNKIYARNGYCFQTARARAVFGPGCFPPFGRLNPWETQRVQEIQMWERQNGC
jgi:hypothetical protein